MIAPETNVLVRVVTRDDERQAAVATNVLRSNDLYFAKSVILELEWVLRDSYGFDRGAVNRALTLLIGLENAIVEDTDAVERAVSLHSDGMDFADALHLASSGAAEELVTFDRRLADMGGTLEGRPAVRLL